MDHRITRRMALAGLAAVSMPHLGLATDMGAHRFSFPNIDGGDYPLAEWAGRPVLVVNTASRCGFTYQYDGLQALYDRYRDRGLVVLTVPSDDFGGQELATEAEVKEFCAVNFNLDLPMTTITPVRGRDRHPFYEWAEQAGGSNGRPGWNFHKILVGPDGRFLAGYPSSVKPEAAKITRAVESALAEG